MKDSNSENILNKGKNSKEKQTSINKKQKNNEEMTDNNNRINIGTNNSINMAKSSFGKNTYISSLNPNNLKSDNFEEN